MLKIKKDHIFVQIASYRDPELQATLADLYNQALEPEKLHVCIAWQHGEDEDISLFDPFLKYRPTILDISYKDSEGTCWARNLIQQEYKGEEFTLQLDSHHRFVEHWDAVCKDMILNLQAKGHKKPLLTAYLPSYQPANDPDGREKDPWWMTFDRFIPEGAIFFLPAAIPGWRDLDSPIPSRFYSAHFCFTLGSFCEEVQHDPNMYFHGEEISIAVRAYTHGYDLFHPHRLVAWHEYTREGRAKHWDENPGWIAKNKQSHRRNRILFGMEEGCSPCMRKDLAPYSFGTERTFYDYQRYAGIRFKTRGVQQYTLDNKFPPNPEIEDPQEYIDSFIPRFKHCIDLHKSYVRGKDFDFIAVIFENEEGRMMYREDIQADDIPELMKKKGDFMNVWREFITHVEPYQWVVWGHSPTTGWGEKIVTKLRS